MPVKTRSMIKKEQQQMQQQQMQQQQIETPRQPIDETNEINYLIEKYNNLKNISEYNILDAIVTKQTFQHMAFSDILLANNKIKRRLIRMIDFVEVIRKAINKTTTMNLQNILRNLIVDAIIATFRYTEGVFIANLFMGLGVEFEGDLFNMTIKKIKEIRNEMIKLKYTDEQIDKFNDATDEYVSNVVKYV